MHIYFYDTYETIRHRIQRSPNLDEGVIRTVLQLLEDNPYVCVFWSLGNVANLDEYRIEHNTDIGVDQRRYNAPAISQVAAIWEEGSDIVSARKYYCYKLQMRPNEFNIMFYGGRLFQQWLIDMYVMVESMRLDWYSLPKHQKIIWVELYCGIVDMLKASEACASEVGRLIFLPRNFNGSERDVQAWFLNAMTLVQRFGKPNYFATMTWNPYWEEIDKELLPGQTPQDCLELVARVYRSKLRNLHDRLIKKKHLGEVLAYAHVTEFQKCGLPHEHFLLVIANKDKLRFPDEFDKYTSCW
jgi:hypothetical protein